MNAVQSAGLVLWRHAEAEEPGSHKADAERVLTARGRGQAELMGKWLGARLPGDARILVSPAVRTVQTAASLDRPGLLDARVGLAATPQAIMDAARWPHPGITVVVGHQPTLGELAALLLNRRLELALDRCEIVWIESVNGTAQLKIRLTPQQIFPAS